MGLDVNVLKLKLIINRNKWRTENQIASFDWVGPCVVIWPPKHDLNVDKPLMYFGFLLWFESCKQFLFQTKYSFDDENDAVR